MSKDTHRQSRWGLYAFILAAIDMVVIIVLHACPDDGPVPADEGKPAPTQPQPAEVPE